MPLRAARYQKISIHALRGEGDGYYKSEKHKAEISIHALRGEGDTKVLSIVLLIRLFQSTPSVGRAMTKTAYGGADKIFQSTPSVGRAMNNANRKHNDTAISIHALRGEGDLKTLIAEPRRIDFNPRPPWGGR